MTVNILSIDCNKPFQGKGRRNGNSMTFDEGLDPHLDQIQQPGKESDEEWTPEYSVDQLFLTTADVVLRFCRMVTTVNRSQSKGERRGGHNNR